MSEFLACIMGSRLTATQSSVTRPLSTTVKLEVQIRSEWGKTCSLGWKKDFSPCDFGLSGFVYKTTGLFWHVL